MRDCFLYGETSVMYKGDLDPGGLTLPMNAGASDYFECRDFGGQNITVRLEKIDTGANDPSWIIEPGPNKVWLEYLNSNLDRYQAKCHCEVAAGSQMHVWVETEHNGKKQDLDGLLIQDWQGNKWTVDVVNVNVRSGPASVTFNLTAGELPHH